MSNDGDQPGPSGLNTWTAPESSDFDSDDSDDSDYDLLNEPTIRLGDKRPAMPTEEQIEQKAKKVKLIKRN